MLLANSASRAGCGGTGPLARDVTKKEVSRGKAKHNLDDSGHV